MFRYLRRKLATKWIGIKINRLLGFMELIIMRLYKDEKIINLINKVRKEEKIFLFKPSELCFIYSLSLAQRKFDGDYAEVGVYKGLSAKMICEAKGNKHFHLFDTFGGLPYIDENEAQFSKNQFSANLNLVKEKLAKYKNIYIYKGLFPETANFIKNKKFAFVHLDVDVYKSTKDCLEFFYKKMQKGGIILSHDYSQIEGVKKAFNEFFKNKPEEIIELPMSQCMIIKL